MQSGARSGCGAQRLASVMLEGIFYVISVRRIIVQLVSSVRRHLEASNHL